MCFEFAVILLLKILYLLLNCCRVLIATGFRKITVASSKSSMAASRSKEGVTEEWTSLCRTYGLNNDTIQVLEREECKSPILALTEDDVEILPISTRQRRFLNNMLTYMKTRRKLAARIGNKKLLAEVRKAFPTDRYTVEAHCLEEEGGSEVLDTVTVSIIDNQQNEVLIYCKPYTISLKTEILEFDNDGDHLFGLVEEAMEMMDGGNYKGALLLLPEKTFLPRHLRRHLAEMLQQKGNIFTLRHTDRFVSDVREEVNKLLKDGEEEEEEEEHGELERTTPIRGKAYHREDSAVDEDRREHDKVDPRTPQAKSERSSVRSKVNRKLYPELPESPTEDSDTRSATTVRETTPKEPGGTCDVRSKADNSSYDKEQTSTRFPYAPPSSRHPTKVRTSDGRSKETTACKKIKVSSSTATTSLVSSDIHVKKDDTLVDMPYAEENKIAAGLHARSSKLDSFADHPADYPTPMETESVPFQQDKYSSGYSSSYSPSYSAGPPKKDGTPDMRYKANKIACGMYGYKKDGTPDRRFKANRR